MGYNHGLAWVGPTSAAGLWLVFQVELGLGHDGSKILLADSSCGKGRVCTLKSSCSIAWENLLPCKKGKEVKAQVYSLSSLGSWEWGWSKTMWRILKGPFDKLIAY